jgi:response regulator NasT
MKILLADRDQARATALTAELQAQDDAFSIILVGGGENLLDAVRRIAPDVVIVDMARPDRDGLDSLRQLHDQHPYPVLMFTDKDDPAFMEAAIAAGVSSYHVRTAALPEIKPVLRTAIALFRRAQEMAARLAMAEEQLAARHAIDAAKRLLMKEGRLSEPAAHRLLQRRAMEQRKRLADVALAMLRNAERMHQGE